MFQQSNIDIVHVYVVAHFYFHITLYVHGLVG
jgi:hypothetical protein